MENLEKDLLDLVSSVIEVSKKRELRLADLNALAKKAEAVKGSFLFTKRLINEISSKSASSVGKLKTTEEELEQTKKSFLQEQAKNEGIIRELKEQIQQLEGEKKNNSSELISVIAENDKLKESSTLMRDELQKSYMTISAYEEQILRLNQQFSLESLEKQKREEFLEKKVMDLTNKVDSMEEDMYDPEAYYCLERDRVIDWYESNELVFRGGEPLGGRAASNDSNKREEGVATHGEDERVRIVVSASEGITSGTRRDECSNGKCAERAGDHEIGARGKRKASERFAKTYKCCG